jgi:Uma2 family endonuclease
MPPIATTSEERLMNVDEFWNFCVAEENEDRSFDLIRGKVIEIPRRYFLHGIVCAKIGYALSTWEQNERIGYTVSNNSGVILEYEPATVLGPDIAFYTHATSFEDLPERWGEAAPLLAVEVTCPSDLLGHLDIRVKLYLGSGSKLVRVVDPEKQTVTVHRSKGKPEIIPVTGELNGGEDLPGFRSPVSAFFPKSKS